MVAIRITPDIRVRTNLSISTRRASLALAALAFALYLPGFWWGAPHATAPDRTHAWGTDDETPLGPLAQIHNIIQPKPDRNLGYPLMHSFIVCAAYTPYLGYLWASGSFTNASGAYPFGLADPVGALKALSFIAHFVSVLMGVGIVLAAYSAGRALWGDRTGAVAALIVMVSFPMFYYSRTGNVDIAVLFFTALALAVFASIIAEGFSVRRAAWLGLFVGFAVGTKEPSMASFLALPFVLVALHRRNNKTRWGWFAWSFWKAPVVAAFTAFMAFGLGSGLFIDPERYFAHVEFVRGRLGAITEGGVGFMSTSPYTLSGHLHLVGQITGYLSDAMTLPGLLIATFGVVWAIRREPWISTFALPALTLLLVLFWSARTAQLRYVMPAAFTLAFFAARVAVRAWESSRLSVRVGFIMLTFAIIGVGLLRGADLTYAMINDSRYTAAAWLEPRTRIGDRIEYFGIAEKLPPLKQGVVTDRAIPYLGPLQRPRIDEDVECEIRQGWKERMPKYVIIIPDFHSSSEVPDNVSCPPRIYQGLLDGSLGYHLAADFQTPSLLPWARRPSIDYPVVNPPIRIFALAGEVNTK
jgi:hypothetical protein